ncbi:MASE1 domain-containing protein [Archangium sp.]|uniref:MASE1 domain-containing protein n=1 Tax=Archangium sp. TaxID=1872627 RepID=UPI002EDA84D9
MPDSKHIPQRWHPLARLALFALAYGVSTWVGKGLTAPGERVSAMWPSSGVALAALLLSRFRDWPALLLVALVVNPLSFAPGKVPSPVSFALSAANALEALTGALLLRRYVGFRPSLERVRDVLALGVVGALLSPMLSATLGVTFQALHGRFPWADWASHWRVFWVGNAMGVLLVAPALLAWATRGLEGWSRARPWELAALLGTLGLTMHLAFLLAPLDAGFYHPVSSLALPFLLWAALRFEARGTAAALLALASVVILHTLAGHGPFATGPQGSGTSGERVVFLQVFLAALASSGLLLAAALGERRQAQEKVSHLNRELRQSLAELAAAQQALVDRERLAALGELSASVAHEVRHPLAVLSNAVAALTRLARPEDNSTAWELLGVMGEEVTRLDQLVHGLLDFARPEEPQLLSQPLGSVVEGALDAALRSVPGSSQVRVTRAVELELHSPVDAQLLHLALSNVFTNALQAMPQGGSLQVELRREVREGLALARLAITDSGPGIPPEVLARVFEPFYTTKAAGTGLGLPIVRRIIDAHRGEVRVHSTVGQGTTVVVHLPLCLATRTTSAA